MKAKTASGLEIRIDQLTKRDPVGNAKIIAKLKRQLRKISSI